ncbi:MAG: divalent-cation tolerance protein CutA [Rhizomicrobium sp.]|jgi:periplasmic divalent cation tolerance protein
MDQTEFVFLYSTFPDTAAAEAVGRLLVGQGLAACVNIYPAMTSIYMWEGRTERAAEAAAFIKTRRALVDDVIAAARPHHPYAVPCFLVLPISGGNEDYLAWAREQTDRATRNVGSGGV